MTLARAGEPCQTSSPGPAACSQGAGVPWPWATQLFVRTFIWTLWRLAKDGQGR